MSEQAYSVEFDLYTFLPGVGIEERLCGAVWRVVKEGVGVWPNSAQPR